MKSLVSAEEGRVEDAGRCCKGDGRATLAPTTRELNAFYTLFPLPILLGREKERSGGTLLMSGDSAKW